MCDYCQATEEAHKQLKDIMGEAVAEGLIDRVEGAVTRDECIEMKDEGEKIFFKLLWKARQASGNNEVYILARSLEEEGLEEAAVKARHWVLIQETVEREIELLSLDTVSEILEGLDDIELEERKVVRIDDDPSDLLSKVIDAFKQKQGDVAPFLISRKLENIMTSEINPPEELKAQI